MGARGEGLNNDFGGSLSDNRMIVHGSESLRRAGRRRVPQREEESKYDLVDADEGGCKTYFSTGDGCDAIALFAQTRKRQEVRQNRLDDINNTQPQSFPINHIDI